MFDIKFDSHRSAVARSGFLINGTAFICSGPSGGGTRPSGAGGEHALYAAPQTRIFIVPSVNEIEVDCNPNGPDCVIEFINAAGTVSRSEVVSGSTRVRNNWSAAATASISVTGLEVEIFSIRGS